MNKIKQYFILVVTIALISAYLNMCSHASAAEPYSDERPASSIFVCVENH